MNRFTEQELWKIVHLVCNQEYELESDYELGIKVLNMLPDSENKTYYLKSFSKSLSAIIDNELAAELHIAQHYMK
jgi:hypothetical protein